MKAEVISRIHAACRIDGEHWIWAGAMTDGTPVMRVTLDAGTSHQRDSVQTVRRVLASTLRGRALRRGEFAGAGCPVAGCVSPYCLVTGSKGKAVLSAVERGAYRNPIRHRRMAATRRARSAFSDTAVQRIRESTGPARAVAEAEGCSISYVYLLRKGGCRTDQGTHWLGLGGRRP